LIGSVLPFGLLSTKASDLIIGNNILMTTVFSWITLSTAFSAWGMWALRRSFSITIEARLLVTGGPYRWIRHPIYLGEILAAAAVIVWRWSLVNVGIFMLFVAIQLFRARREDAKLTRAVAAYKDFSGRIIVASGGVNAATNSPGDLGRYKNGSAKKSQLHERRFFILGDQDRGQYLESSADHRRTSKDHE
jgi:hypothetical protein